MKKLLLAGVAAFAVASVATPASAEVDLSLGGYFSGYGAFVDQDEDAVTAGEVRNFDILRNTEVHLSGETTLDNGLTVGAHLEMKADPNSGQANDSFDIKESYVYFSGGWGRVNFGAEDGAAYLLQVAAPSADSNVDGLRQYIQPFNYGELDGATATLTPVGAIDYQNNASGTVDKLTYLTPVFAGFQAGLSYTPDPASGDDLGGVRLDNQANALGDFVDLAARYEGEFEGVGFAVGAGYTTAGQEGAAGVAVTDDFNEWNVGLDLNVAAFGLGVVYTESNNALAETVALTDEETLVVGADWTNGNFKVGASYLNTDNINSTDDLNVTRYTGGVVYTYGPGMTFRGSIQQTEFENGGGAGVDVDGTAVLLGTQINF